MTCRGCGASLGSRTAAGNLKLYKWSLKVKSTPEKTWSIPTLAAILRTHLFLSIEHQGVRKFLALDGDEENASYALLLWVFTPDLMYSSTKDDQGPRRAMKILYKATEEPSKILDWQRMCLEDMELPTDDLKSLCTTLRQSTDILPASARKIQEWDVALLNH